MMKIRSTTLNKIINESKAWYSKTATVITIISGSVYLLLSIEAAKFIALGFLFVLVLIFIKSMIDAVDEEFLKLESVDNNQSKTIGEIEQISKSIKILDVLNNKVCDIEGTVCELKESYNVIGEEIDTEIFDYIFIKERKGYSGALVIIMKSNKCTSHDFEMMFISKYINKLRFEVDVLVNKKFNAIEMNNVNCRDSETPYSIIKFNIKKGINIGVLRVTLNGDINDMVLLEFSLLNKTQDKTIINQAHLLFEEFSSDY